MSVELDYKQWHCTLSLLRVGGLGQDWAEVGQVRVSGGGVGGRLSVDILECGVLLQ